MDAGPFRARPITASGSARPPSIRELFRSKKSGSDNDLRGRDPGRIDRRQQMKVQTKIVLLLVLLLVIFISGLVVVRLFADRRLKAIADERAAERTRSFDEFLAERGDRLSAIVDDSTNWDDLVRALRADDHTWADETISLETLATRDFNAVWIYKPDLSLFHSKNNRYADSLREAPIPREALQRLLGTREVAHFFVNTREGWMELRGATIHPSRDRFRETPAQGYFLAGRFWIDENIRQMSAFT